MKNYIISLSDSFLFRRRAAHWAQCTYLQPCLQRAHTQQVFYSFLNGKLLFHDMATLARFSHLLCFLRIFRFSKMSLNIDFTNCI